LRQSREHSGQDRLAFWYLTGKVIIAEVIMMTKTLCTIPKQHNEWISCMLLAKCRPAQSLGQMHELLA